jgi:hypothetical protein
MLRKWIVSGISFNPFFFVRLLSQRCFAVFSMR